MVLISKFCSSNDNKFSLLDSNFDNNAKYRRSIGNVINEMDLIPVNQTYDADRTENTTVELGRLMDNVEQTTEYENFTEEPCVGDPDFCNMTKEEYIEMLNDYIFPQPYEWVLIATHAIVFVIGLIGNALVCIAVYRNHSMRTVTNYFIVNLAVADFMVILICLPPTVLWDVTETWFFGTAMCRIVLYFQVCRFISYFNNSPNE